MSTRRVSKRKQHGLGPQSDSYPDAVVLSLTSAASLSLCSAHFLSLLSSADAITSGEKLPVFVWIFGGAWVLGDGYEFGLYDGHNVAKARNHIIVTFNYRLGPLGFMANDAMRDETELGTAGNMGLLDQVKVLQWVQKNIANFGGDPDRVTIAGESAGAFSVCWHLASPLSAGLFHAAILESGTCDSAAFFMPYELSRNWTNTFVGMVGCNPDANSSTVMSCLRALPTGKIMGDILEAKSADVAGNVGQLRSAYEDLMASGATQWGYTPLLFPLMSWGATIDGVSLLDMPLNQIASGNYNKVPAIQGTNNDEGTIFVPAMPLIIPGIHWPTQSGDLEIAMNYIFGGNQTTVGGIISLYPQSNYASAEATFNVILRDYMFVCPARRALSAMNAAGASTWLYHWDYQGDWIDDLLFGDYHSAELEFVFANQWPPIMHMFSLNDYTMANTVDTYWNNMVWYHNPNGNESVTDSVSRRTQLKDEEFWAEYSPEQNRQNMVLAVPTRVEQDYFESQCEFWDSVDSFNRVGAEVKKFDAPAPKKHPKHAAPAKPKQHLSEKPLKKHAPTHASKPKKHHLRQH